MKERLSHMTDEEKVEARKKAMNMTGREMTAEVRKETPPPYWDIENRSGQWKDV